MPDIIDGRQVVASAGTRVQLAASQAVRSLTVQAETDNTSPVTVGGPTVVGALATRRGIGLAAGQSHRFEADEVNDLGDVYIDAVTSTEGVTYIAVTE